MQLKTYQVNTLNTLKSYFEQARLVGHIEAFNIITSGEEVAPRLANIKNTYTPWPELPNTPRVCIKVPTGGGKTIIAAHTIKIAAQVWRETDYPLVLWFVPSDTIRRQTAEALKNPRHPYREALDEQFAGKVRVFDLDEKFNIRPADIADNACIIVATMQSFVKEDTQKYNVYRDNENLEPHFSKMPAGSFAQMQKTLDGKRARYSFANLLNYHRPIMIVDEAHKVVTDLSRETLGRINPAAVIEFTATPQDANNTLYNVRAAELKAEEMIKLPIVLVEHKNWQEAVDDALNRREALEKDAENEEEYIRPILLFQAQAKGGEVTTDVLKQYLLDNAKITGDEIKIATGEQKELDGINLFDRAEKVRYIITIEALKEGWDCSFAYVLCSLANVQSDNTVIQLLGRVMRMPYAKNRKTPSLNKAYASVLSDRFGASADALVEKLKNKGFESDEAKASIQVDYSLFQITPGAINTYKPATKLRASELPQSVKLDNDNTITFSEKTTREEIETIVKKLDKEEAKELEKAFDVFQQIARKPSPAEKGETFTVPRLMVSEDGFLQFASPDNIYAFFYQNIQDYADPKLSESDFNIIGNYGDGFSIDINNNRLVNTFLDKSQLLPFMEDTDVFTPVNFINWLDSNLKQNDISQPQMVVWLRKVIDHLTETRKIPLANLVIAKFSLLNVLTSRIENAREKAHKKSFELFHKDQERVLLDFDNGYVFKKGMYDFIIPNEGTYQFQKHFLSIIPSFDGGENGEEGECAKLIDANPNVKYWIRNVEQQPASFKLPTPKGYFYPDFAAQLKDGRILIVEYKGNHLVTNDDTKDKRIIGETWEKNSKGKGLFLIATQDPKTKRDANGKTVEQQIAEAIGK